MKTHQIARLVEQLRQRRTHALQALALRQLAGLGAGLDHHVVGGGDGRQRP